MGEPDKDGVGAGGGPVTATPGRKCDGGEDQPGDVGRRRVGPAPGGGPCPGRGRVLGVCGPGLRVGRGVARPG